VVRQHLRSQEVAAGPAMQGLSYYG